VKICHCSGCGAGGASHCATGFWSESPFPFLTARVPWLKIGLAVEKVKKTFVNLRVGFKVDSGPHYLLLKKMQAVAEVVCANKRWSALYGEIFSRFLDESPQEHVDIGKPIRDVLKRAIDSRAFQQQLDSAVPASVSKVFLVNMLATYIATTLPLNQMAELSTYMERQIDSALAQIFRNTGGFMSHVHSGAHQARLFVVQAALHKR
jgi:hypothetical protein